jgi:hypothetical protein
MPRPPEYLDELRACAIEVNENVMAFDVDSDAYRALKEKYRDSPQERPPMPIPDDYDPNTSPQSPRVGGCCDPPKAT